MKCNKKIALFLTVALGITHFLTITTYTNPVKNTETIQKNTVMKMYNSSNQPINTQGYNKIKTGETLKLSIIGQQFNSPITTEEDKVKFKKEIIKNEAIKISFALIDTANKNDIKPDSTLKLTEDMISFGINGANENYISINFPTNFPNSKKGTSHVVIAEVKKSLDSKDYKFKNNFNFIVDETAPVAKMFDVSSENEIEINQNDMPYLFKSNDSKFQIKLSDNYGINNCDIKLDGNDLNKTISDDGIIEILGSDIENDGIHSLVVSVTDYVGNSPYPIPVFNLRKDTTDTTFDVLGLKNLTNQPINVTVNITDYNLELTEIFIDDEVVSTINHSGSATFTYSKEGIHKFKIVTTDYADNKKEIYNVPFTIDMTPPVIKFNTATINSTGFTNMSYKPACTLQEGALMDGDTISYYEVNGTSYSPNELNALSEEGTYNVTAYACDPAGNTSSKNISFNIDKTLPTINIDGIFNNFYYNKSVAPTIDISDKNIKEKSSLLNGNNFVSGTEVTSEGEHELMAKGLDMADNSNENTFLFTIDKTKPSVAINGVVNNSIINKFIKPIIDISENNSLVSMLLNGEEYHGELISTDGKYTLLIKVVDKAGNLTEQLITFVLDTTQPKIKISGVEDGKFYKETVKPNIKTYEEADLVMTLNGNTYNGEEISEPGEYALIAKATDKAGNSSEEIVEFTILEDKEDAPPGCEISTSNPEQPVESQSFLAQNKGSVIAGSVVGVLVIISVITYLVIKKRKNIK